MEPGPTPTFTPSTPASISAFVADAVATLPAMISSSGKVFLARATDSITISECPWDVSTTTTSTAVSIRLSILSRVSSPTPTAAPTRKRPKSSLQAFGYFLIFSISLMVMRPTSLPLSSTTRSFSMRRSCIIAFESSRVIPVFAVARFSWVITDPTVWSRLVSNLRSLLVIMPTRLSPLTTGTPEILYWFMISRTSWIFRSGSMVMGLTIMPLSDFLTFLTSSACRSMLMFLWINPIPPCRAMVMAVSASVTVSMAAETTGILSRTLRDNRVCTLTSVGNTADRSGIRMRSSNV